MQSVEVGAAPCDETCRELALTATVGSSSVEFERAYYGMTAPELSNSGSWELHVEVYRGGATGCPAQDSPTPDQTLIVSNMQFPEVPLTVTDADGLAVNLLDFAGDLTTAPALPATGEELTWTRWELCIDCGDSDGFLAFNLSAPVEGGQVAGHVYATHCASLDSR